MVGGFTLRVKYDGWTLDTTFVTASKGYVQQTNLPIPAQVPMAAAGFQAAQSLAFSGASMRVCIGEAKWMWLAEFIRIDK